MNAEIINNWMFPNYHGIISKAKVYCANEMRDKADFRGVGIKIEATVNGIVTVYKSISDCGRWLSMCHSDICRYLRNKKEFKRKNGDVVSFRKVVE